MGDAGPSSRRPRQDSAVATELFDDGEFVAVLFDGRNASVHRLESLACAVWTLCDGIHDVESMVEVLVDLVPYERREGSALVEQAVAQLDCTGLLAEGL